MKSPIKVIGSIRRVRDASGAEMVLAGRVEVESDVEGEADANT
jgi:hypothetical protein